MNYKTLLSPKEWWIEESAFNIEKINIYETLLAIGNGYLGIRGSLEEGHTAALPGVFINGIFDNYDSDTTNLVNAPNWLPVSIWANGERLNLQTCKILEYRRILDIRTGLLYRLTRFEDPKGQITRYESIRYANFAKRHCCELDFAITAENYSGKIKIVTMIDGHVSNLDRMPVYKEAKPKFDPEIKWRKRTRSRHLAHVSANGIKKGVYLEMKTLSRNYRLGYAESLQIFADNCSLDKYYDYEHVSHCAQINIKQGDTMRLEKLVSIVTNRDVREVKLQSTCVAILDQQLELNLEQRFAEHKEALEKKWQDSDCLIEGDQDAQQAVRFNIYHLLICASEHDAKVNIGARSLTGEGYKGHAFWDTEIFMLPFYIYTQPETAKALLLYRYHNLKGAIKNAKATGFKGARFPWESADTGLEETPKYSPNGKERYLTGEQEIHITSDVVYAIFTYYIATGDIDFLLNYAAEILFETARFWISRLEYNTEENCYQLNCVIGPDEFHEHINNNAYTNRMVKWNLEKACEIYHWIKNENPQKFQEIINKINLAEMEIENCHDIAAKIYIPYDASQHLIEEFAGYFKLEDIPITEWDSNNMPIFPTEKHAFNCRTTTLIKQADVVLLLYLLADEFSDEVKKTNYEYYEKRTMHKSSLSPSIYAIMAIETDHTDKVMQYFKRAAFVDLINNQKNAEMGIHIASAGGTWQIMMFGFGGLRVKKSKLTFKPWLPKSWQKLQFKIKWRAGTLQVTLTANQIAFLWQHSQLPQLEIMVYDKVVALQSGMKIGINY